MFAQRLKDLRKSNGYTAQYMADNLQTGIRNYRKYESGHAAPTLEGIVKIAKLLHVSTDYLLCGEYFLQDIEAPVEES